MLMYQKISKIKWPENYKRMFTLADMEACKLIEKNLKENSDNGKLNFEWEVCCAAIAGSDSHVCDADVIQAEAEFCKNSRVYERICDGSGSCDVWIKVKAYSVYYGFYDIRVCLTDLWDYSSENADYIKSHMYIVHCTPDNKD